MWTGGGTRGWGFQCERPAWMALSSSSLSMGPREASSSSRGALADRAASVGGGLC